MKKTNLQLLLLFGMLLIFGCSKKDASPSSSGSTTGVVVNPNAPALKLSLNPTTATTGIPVTITLVATAKKKSKVFHIQLNERFNGITTSLIDTSGLSDSSRIMIYTYKRGAPGKRTIILIATDNALNTDSISQTIDITGALLAPSLTLNISPTSIDAGSSFKVSYTASTSFAPLSNLKIRIQAGKTDTIALDSALGNITSLNGNKTYYSDYSFSGTINIIISVSDKNGVISTQTKTVTVANPLRVYNIVLGAQDNASYHHAINFYTGAYYDSANATTSNVDAFLMGYKNSYMEIASPTSSYLPAAYPWTSSLSGARKTSFNYYSTKLNQLTSLSQIKANYNSGVGTSSISDLVSINYQTGVAYTFKTADGKYGFMYVYNVLQGGNGYTDGYAQLLIVIQQ